MATRQCVKDMHIHVCVCACINCDYVSHITYTSHTHTRQNPNLRDMYPHCCIIVTYALTTKTYRTQQRVPIDSIYM